MSLLPCSIGQAVAESRFKERRQRPHLFWGEMMFKVQGSLKLNSCKERGWLKARKGHRTYLEKI